MFGLFPQKKLRVALPKQTRVVAIGDIHGQKKRFRTLMNRVDKIRNEAPVKNDYLVFLGDYVDRGPFSAETIEYLSNRQKKATESDAHNEIFLQGNHEELLLEGLNDEGTRHDLWWRNGGLQTVDSYLNFLKIDVSSDMSMQDQLILLRTHFPKNHLKFFEGLKDIYQVGPLVFAHAGLRMDKATDDQKAQDLRWIRDPFLNWRGAKKDFLVVHGHSITKGFKPELMKHRIGIDTGSYKTKGRITAAIFESNTVRFISSGTKKDFEVNNFSA